MVTAGPTYEAIDPVRFIGNHSSGKMGIAIAEELYRQGAEVTLVLGPCSQKVHEKINTIRVWSAEEMYLAAINIFDAMDIAIMSAAVADYTPAEVASEKIKKNADEFSLHLVKTKDILKSLGEKKKPGQILAGFALETTNEKENALAKLKSKNADLIILNSLKEEGAGFGHDTNKISIFDKSGKENLFDRKTKKEVAVDIIKTIIQIMS